MWFKDIWYLFMLLREQCKKSEKILSQIDFKRKLVRLPVKSGAVIGALVNDILVWQDSSQKSRLMSERY